MQFYSLFWGDDKKYHKKLWIQVTAKSWPMMSLIARAQSNVPSSTSESPEKRSSKSMWCQSWEKERIERDNPLWTATHVTSQWHHHKQICWKLVLSTLLSAWSSQEWKADPPMGDKTGNLLWLLEKSSRVQSSFFHEKTQHDGTAQSVVNEVILRDRPGQPVVIFQRGARSQQCVIGNDETELELTKESRSFVNKINDQVRKRQRSSMTVTEDDEKHSEIWRECSCLLQWNQQYSWERITWTIVNLSRTQKISH